MANKYEHKKRKKDIELVVERKKERKTERKKERKVKDTKIVSRTRK